MKLSILILFIPFACASQPFSVSINGGVGTNTAPMLGGKGVKGYPLFTSTTLKISPVFKLEGLYHFRKYQLGLNAVLQDIGMKGKGNKMELSKPSKTISIVANRDFGGFYAGASFGLVLPDKKGTPFNYGQPDLKYPHSMGYTAGTQFGYLTDINSKLALNLGGMGRYSRLYHTFDDGSGPGGLAHFVTWVYSYWNFAATIGIVYKIGGGTRREEATIGRN